MSMNFESPWVVVLASPDEHGSFLARPELRCNAGAVEIRLDRWRPPRLEDCIAALPVPAILTWRRSASRPEPELAQTIRAAALGELGPCIIDLDHRDPLVSEVVGARLRRPAVATLVPLILSDHRDAPAASDGEIHALEERMTRAGASAAKIVLAFDGQVESYGAALRLARRNAERPHSIFLGGVAGVASRLLSVGRGNRWCYGRLPGSLGTDPGQPAVALLSSRYGSIEWGSGVPLYAVIGADVRRSLSPGYHNRLFRRTGTSGLFIDISVAALGGLLVQPELPFAGLAVTAPHKIAAAALAAPGDDSQRIYPAWNTLRRDAHGNWVGFNTDGEALCEILAAHRLEPPALVVVLGRGGAALGVAAALRHRGYAVETLDRRAPAADAYGRDTASAQVADAAVIVNATPAGRDGSDPMPWPIDRFRGSLAVELNYEPERTWFLDRATRAGARPVHGLEFFAAQARLQARVLYGLDVSRTDSLDLAASALSDLEQDPTGGA